MMLRRYKNSVKQEKQVAEKPPVKPVIEQPDKGVELPPPEPVAEKPPVRRGRRKKDDAE